MKLSDTTLRELREIINEKSKYRSGPELVEFFSDFGFDDVYGEGFPSRWFYTDSRLESINDRPEIERCIKKVFAPKLFIGDYSRLDELIDYFNQYISYDGWIIKRNGKEIVFYETDKIYEKDLTTFTNKSEFLSIDFGDIDLSELNIDSKIFDILNSRIKELKSVIKTKSPLASIIMIGGILEGLLLAFAKKHPKQFNQSKATPTDKNGDIKRFYNWTLNDFINVTYDLGIFKEDVFKFTGSLREFRNYIHPYQQLSTGFEPTEDTVHICYQVLKSVINQLSKSSY